MHVRQRFYAQLPEDMSGSEVITRQKSSFCELFNFVNWQGVGLVRYMYLLGMWSIGIFNLVILISGLASGQGMVIIGVIIFVPVFSVAELVVLRIICEVCVVILLLPHYVKGGAHGNNPEANVERMDDIESAGDGLDASVHRNMNKRGGGAGNSATNPMAGYTNLAV